MRARSAVLSAGGLPDYSRLVRISTAGVLQLGADNGRGFEWIWIRVHHGKFAGGDIFAGGPGGAARGAGTSTDGLSRHHVPLEELSAAF